MRSLILIICVLVLLTIVDSKQHDKKPQFGDVPVRNGTVIGRAVRSYNVNIDDPPIQRWKPIIDDYRSEILKFYNDNVPQSSRPMLTLMGIVAKTIYHDEFIREIKAISKIGQIPFGQVLSLNLMYELHDYKSCTSIIARTQAGNIILGRNLDYDFAQYLANLTAIINYQRNGKTIFTVNSLVGSVLVVSGVRHGAYAISQDERLYGGQKENLWQLILRRATPTLYQMFKILRDESTYDSAVTRLTNQRISAPGYYIISGTQNDQGMVIERNRNGFHNYYTLSEDVWFLVQTNYDRDVPDKMDDYRRIPAEQRMNQIGKENISIQNLYDDVLRNYPNFNSQTLLTTMMDPVNNYFNATLWY